MTCPYGEILERCDTAAFITALAIVANGREIKPRPYKCRPLPDDFAEQSAGRSDRSLCDHYHAGIMTVRRWVQQSGVPQHRTLLRPVPDDFSEVAPTLTHRGLCDHYRCHWHTVKRWLEETGITPKRRPKPAPRPESSHRKPYRNDGFAGPKSAFVGILPRDMSIEGQAADVLRRHTFVFRCREGGCADQHGEYWRYGNVVMTGKELVERAKRHGFDPNGWDRVAHPQLSVGKSARFSRLPIGDMAQAGA